jgi:ABC transporter related
MTQIVKAENLKKTFVLSAKQRRLDHTSDRLKTAVNGLSFTVNEGEIFGLLGPNGAGKTTTLRMLATLIKPDSGDALIDNSSIISNPNDVRAKIGFLTSELKMEEAFSPAYLFNFFSELHNVPPDLREQRRRELFDIFGINKFAEVKVADLSTGMKQKTSLAVSLVHDPKVIIFDEPTNGLDVITAKTVTDFLVSLKQKGKTVIVSTHIFSLIEKICDRVGVIIDGRMAVCGDLAEVCDGKSLEDRFFDLYSERVAE